MHELAQRLLRTIRKRALLRAGDHVAVAVSGGADSVALLLLLVELRGELGIGLSVAHVNHKLRGAESDQDERFVAELAARLGLELAVCTAPVARGRGAGIESEGRRVRYEFFRQLVEEGRTTKIATAHTLDDQAETVLLRMFRGTGIRGLAGILPRLRFNIGGKPCGEVVRPLLGFRRAELRAYLRERGQAWREDSSNKDVSFLRNRVRQRLLPMIAAEFGGAAVEHIAELAEIARAEDELSAQYAVAGVQSTKRTALGVKQLLALPLAVARRFVRAWIETNAPEASISFRLIEEILDLAHGPAGKKLELSGKVEGGNGVRFVRRSRKELVLETTTGSGQGNYEYTLPVPGSLAVAELGARFEAQVVEALSVPEAERQALLDPERVAAKLVIRNWRAGDRYWPAHTSAEKKVKELLSDRHVTGVAKKLWPVAVATGQLIWMRGFAAPEAWRARAGNAIWIREIAGLM